MLEIELKSVVPEWEATVRRVETSGGRLVFAGRMEDCGYDTPERAVAARGSVLRVRVYRDPAGVRAELSWKGPATREGGFKRREELGAPIPEPEAFTAILDRLGFAPTFVIDREIRQYEVQGAIVRFERYPRMDELVEIEGSTEQIERAIAATGLPREGFTADRLAEFVRRFEKRTGSTAALSNAALAGPAGRPRTHD
jgi:predicted adenylyl cyclase CyaB